MMRMKRMTGKKKIEEIRRSFSLNLKLLSTDRKKKKNLSKLNFTSFFVDNDESKRVKSEASDAKKKNKNNTVDLRSTSLSMSQLNIMAFESDSEEAPTEDDLAFSSVKKLLLPENATHLSVFINFSLVHSHSEQIFFYLITDLYKRGSPKEMRRWAYEIYSTFLAPDAPLQIFPVHFQELVVNTIENNLHQVDIYKTGNDSSISTVDFEMNKLLREIFQKARIEAMRIINKQLEDFQVKRKAGLEAMYGSPIATVEHLKFYRKGKFAEKKVIEKNLMPKLLLMLEEIESNPEDNVERKLLVSALSTVIHQIFQPRTSYNEPIDQFVSSKIQKSEKSIEVKGHQLSPKICFSTTYCDFCLQIMYGIGPQGYECGCGIKVHESCLKSLRGTCIMAHKDANGARDSVKLFEFVQSALGNKRIEDYKRSKSSRPKSDPGLYNKTSDSSSDDGSYCETYWTNDVALEFLKLNDIQKKRREIIIEFFETERRHVKMLKLLQNVFLEPLKRNRAISIELANALFPPSFFIIKDWHTSFEAIMKKEWHEQNGILLEIGNCLSIFEGSYGNILKENSAKFCAGLKGALDSLREQRSKNEALQRGLIKAESHKGCRRLQLKDLLQSLFQRLTKYPLLLERMHKYCEGPEAERVQQAVESTKLILNFVNMSVRNNEELRGIQEKLIIDKETAVQYGSLQLFQHKLVHDGFLTAKKGAIPMRVLLFDQRIVFLHKHDEKYILKSCDSAKFPVVKTFNIIVRSNASDSRSFFLIVQTEDASQMLELISKNEDECQEWIKKINDTVEDATKNFRRNTLSETAQKVLRSDSRGHLDLKPVDLASIGQALIAQTKQIEECFQISKLTQRNPEQCNTVDIDNFSSSINTLNRLVSQLTMKIAERDHERVLYLKENRKLKDIHQK